jgi:hypothetical protein
MATIPLAVRLRNVTADTRKSKKAPDARVLLLSYRECEAVLRLLGAAKRHLEWSFDQYGGDQANGEFAAAIAALEQP